MEFRNLVLRRFRGAGFLVASFLLLSAILSTGSRNREVNYVVDGDICHGARSAGGIRSVMPGMDIPAPDQARISAEAQASGKSGNIPSVSASVATGAQAASVGMEDDIGASSVADNDDTIGMISRQTTETRDIEATDDGIIGVAMAQAAADNGFGIAAGGDLVYWSQPDLDLYFQGLKDLGATWIRYDIDWQAVQPYGFQTYSWDGVDRVVSTAERYKIRSLGIITYAPQWAQADICPSGKHCPPESATMFALFAGKVAERYEGRIAAYEIWNEPNYQLYWYPVPDAADYTELLKASYLKIKESDPAAVVVTAGLTDMGDTEGVSISPLTFVNTMYESGAKDHFDILGLHPYTYPGFSYGWPHITSIHDIMASNGDSSKSIWATEYGAPTGGPGQAYAIGESGFNYGPDYMTEDAQSEMAEDIFAFRAKNDIWMGNIFWYSLCDSSADRSTTENFFGILRKDGTPKPVYEILKNLFSQ